jgi:hypothetical protein
VLWEYLGRAVMERGDIGIIIVCFIVGVICGFFPFQHHVLLLHPWVAWGVVRFLLTSGFCVS